MSNPNGAGFHDYEDVPRNLYESEFFVKLVSDCCDVGIYRKEGTNTCMNCTEECDVIEDVSIELSIA